MIRMLKQGALVACLFMCLSLIPALVLAADVEIYVTESCGYCRQLESFFDNQGIRYKRYDINRSSRAKKDFESYGGRGVPLTVIDSDTVIRGFKPDRILEALKDSRKATRRSVI